MNLRALRSAALAGLFIVASVPSLLGAESSTNKWEKAIAGFEALDKFIPPPQGAVLFIGSSSIRMWKTLSADFPEHRVINRGFGGSQICDSVFFADRIVIPYKPRIIVFGAGGNDINAGKSPEQVANDFRAFVEKVRAKLPDVRIVFLSINPAPVRAAQLDKVRRTNQLIKAQVDAGKNLDYVDIFEPMMGSDGLPRAELFLKDLLHNNAEGYKLRVKLLAPHLVVAK